MSDESAAAAAAAAGREQHQERGRELPSKNSNFVVDAS